MASFSAYLDESGDVYQGNSLPQLNRETGVINVEKDSLSGVKAVCLTKVIFIFSIFIIY